ncbi:MAG: hypothetical protein EPO32_00385 [Anaerolineae bacterium]|nr:MAG: hypothetical protein EPO32_00385 [Anaerolineae bacterium]
MTPQISPRDLEFLSAFLDNQLSTRDRNRLQTRLIGEPDLKQAMDELRTTRELMRRTPQLKAPRSFVLSREMVSVNIRAVNLARSLRSLSVVAAVLLAMVVTGDVLTGGAGLRGFPGAGAAAPEESAALVQAEPAIETYAGAADTSAPTDTTVPSDIVPEAAGNLSAEGTATPEDTIGLSAPAGEEAVDKTEQADMEFRQTTEIQEEIVPGVPVILLVEGLLAAIVLAAGLGAWIVRRQRPR